MMETLEINGVTEPDPFTINDEELRAYMDSRATSGMCEADLDAVYDALPNY